MARLSLRKVFVFGLCLSAVLFIIITLQVVVELSQLERTAGQRPLQELPETARRPSQSAGARSRESAAGGPEGQYPYVVWWSPLTGESGRLGECGTNKCFFTINKTYYSHPSTQAFLFYGTDFSVERLPLPRREHHHWALFHEESPKNNYKLLHPPALTLFNHTATFSRHAHLPLTTQYLESLAALTSHAHLVSLAHKNQLRRVLAPLAYVQSDCDPPSDRDAYVRELMKHIQVDSYGQCLHNKDLPPHLREPSAMDEAGFHRVLAQYKFVLAFENAVCDDYITEKLWRPLTLGVVPVYYGAPNVRTWLPSNRSAIVVDADEPPEKLAELLKRLDADDGEYSSYLAWKMEGSVSNPGLVRALEGRGWGVHDLMQDNYIDAFECLVCNRLWENIHRREQGLSPSSWQAEGSHLSCPPPQQFDFSAAPGNPTSLREIWGNPTSLREIWGPSYEQSKKEARALRRLADRNKNFTVAQYWKEVFSD